MVDHRFAYLQWRLARPGIAEAIIRITLANPNITRMALWREIARRKENVPVQFRPFFEADPDLFVQRPLRVVVRKKRDR